MNTFTCKPSTEGSSKVTWRLITPNSSINLTRLKQGVGERFTERASSALVMRALSCKALRMAISVRSSFFIKTIILNLEYLENIYPANSNSKCNLINRNGGRDEIASEPPDLQVEVARNDLYTSHPRRTIPNLHS